MKQGNFLEDFSPKKVFQHPIPRTINEGDLALYMGLTGTRNPLHCASDFSLNLGYKKIPIDDILLFHMVFGRTVPDLSLNAIANLGYAAVKFYKPVFVGDTVSAESEIIGLKQNSNGKTGTVYVKSVGTNQNGEVVLSYFRWLMMRKKKNVMIDSFENIVPNLPKELDEKEFEFPSSFDSKNWSTEITGSEFFYDDFIEGEEIHHLDGQTIEEAEHQLATRLYQNNARVHFNHHIEKDGRFGKRIIYGGYIISLARAISCNGLANAFKILAIHSGRHAAPTFSGDTIYAWSKILKKNKINDNLGTLLIRTIASKNDSNINFPKKDNLSENMVLDLEYSVLIPVKK